MRSIQTSYTFPLSSVKPLEGLLRYRMYCLEETRRTLSVSRRRRERSPVGGARLEPFDYVDGFEYLRCPETGNVFLAELADSKNWACLLSAASGYRHSPKAFHSEIIKERNENVYLPKLEWIQNTLRLQGLKKPLLMAVVTPPNEFSYVLERSDAFAEVLTVDEMKLVEEDRDKEKLDPRANQVNGGKKGAVEAAVLPESLDRVDDPLALLRGVRSYLKDDGLIFVTGLVCSGFDFTVLGRNNLYLYPPDRTNCFSLTGLTELLNQSGFVPLEISTPGVLDVEIVLAHLGHDPAIPLSSFERRLLAANPETRAAFQAFLQERGLSSFARIVARKQT